MLGGVVTVAMAARACRMKSVSVRNEQQLFDGEERHGSIRKPMADIFPSAVRGEMRHSTWPRSNVTV